MPLRKISISCGRGSGKTSLSAFDNALFNAGIANHNLLHLSSVIPTGFTPVIEQVNLLDDVTEYGNKLYVVYAARHEQTPQKEAWAGLGWVMAEAEPSRGLFVEHEGETEQEVIDLLTASLTTMTSYRKENYGPIHYKTANVLCTGEPVCVIVAAIYKSVNWD